MVMIVVISIEEPSCDSLNEPAKAAALLRMLADEVLAKLPKLVPGECVRITPKEGLLAVVNCTQA